MFLRQMMPVRGQEVASKWQMCSSQHLCGLLTDALFTAAFRVGCMKCFYELCLSNVISIQASGTLWRTGRLKNLVFEQSLASAGLV